MAAVLTYAIGDIHGSYTKLANLMRHCIDHSGGHDSRFVLLGDYIDRGRRSREVVKFLIEAQEKWPGKVICLKGNHEEMLLNAIIRQDETMWLCNGGEATLQSYGVGHPSEIPGEHLAWMQHLPASHDDGRRFFVHAGIMPGIPLNEQQEDVMLWIREPFLSDGSDHGRYIVHGHTPTETGAPELYHNRLDLDTYAWYGNPLTAAVFDDRRVGPLSFIGDDGSVKAAPPINAREQEMFAPARRAHGR
jgi:serine/threonine protein phosphatase 1